ncbi:MAG: endonuclease dU [Thermoplasmatota archaeon]
MKAEIRVIGFDDGPFTFEDDRVVVVGVVTRGADYVEHLVRTEAEVDGTNATNRILSAVRSVPQFPELHAILLDGCAVGGFNVVDVRRLHAESGIPVITVTKGEPDWAGMKAALQGHDARWSEKWALLEAARPEPLPVAGGAPLFVHGAGLSRAATAEVLARTTVRGTIPEPLRLAHLIARLFRATDPMPACLPKSAAELVREDHNPH